MNRKRSAKLLIVSVLGLAVLVSAFAASAAAPPPTVSIINPKPGTLASPSVISPQRITNNFKVQAQVWNDVADITGVAVGYYQGATPDTGTWTWVNAALNSNYNCGSNCGIYDAVLSLAAGDYYLMARAVSTGDGTGYSRDNRTGNDARYVYIRVVTAGEGTGNLLARDYASQLCLDCHSLPGHSSQYTDTSYQNWQLVCLECHTPHETRNIYLLRETIITPQSGGKSVVFYNNNVGDSTNNTYVNSVAGGSTAGICQVCHTQTQGAGGVARWRNTGNADPNHFQAPNNQKCTLCHSHLQGFRGNCDNCHNSPPTVGKHAAHFGTGTPYYGTTYIQSSASAYGFDCGICHQGTHLNTSGNPHTVEVIFAGIAKQDVASGASYTPSSFAVDDPGKGWTFNYSDGTCANTYCHGNYPGSGKNATVTFNTGTAACGSCHEASNTSPPFTGTHSKHLEPSYYGFKCTMCHKDIITGSGPDYTVADKSKHVSGYVDWKFDNTDPRGAGGSYSIASGTVTPSDGNEGAGRRGYGTCTIYCHSNVQPNGGVGPPSVYAAPKWGTSISDCKSCHGSGTGTGHSIDMNTGSHTAHLAYAFTTSSNIYKCVICHTWDNSESLTCVSCHNFHIPTEYWLHANYQVDMVFDSAFSSVSTAYNGTLAPGDGYSNCSNTYCHSNGTGGTSNSGDTRPIPANTSTNWGSAVLSCSACHGNPPDYANGSPKANSHPIHDVHSVGNCSICHYATTTDGTTIADKSKHVNKIYDLLAKTGYTFTYTYNVAGGSCTSISCHGDAQWGGQGAAGTNCIECHGHDAGYQYEAGKFSQGKGTFKSHSTHTENDADDLRGPNVPCGECHDTNNYPYFKSGTDGNGDGKFNLAETDVCNTCHSSSGTYNGVNDPAIGAKNNWGSGVYAANNQDLLSGKERWCVGCHDNAPAVILGQTATNKSGDNSTYGYYVTGHGRNSSYSRLSWQDTSATGNPAANLLSCAACHDTAKSHISTGPASSRMKFGYENDQANTNCNQCHPPGASAVGNPQFYTNSTAYELSAHKNKLCTECHEVHGSTGAYTGMTKGNKENLCLQCHSGHAGHALGASFNRAGNTYSLQCVSCHNVHIITGLTSVANPNLSVMTRLSNPTQVWGAAAGEKMNNFAGSGTYRTPKGDTMNDAQLPDYPTFCLDCHGQDMRPGSIHGNISWGDLHGTSASNSPPGGGLCPDWFVCGLVEGWDGDDCVAADPNDCWPPKSRSLGDQKFTRPVYSHEERIANVNFVMSCNDCHVTHVSGSGKLRSTVNNTPYTGEWKTLCNACHYYYSQDHAGMSCGAYNSCHNANPNPRPDYGLNGNTIHGMPAGGGGGGTRIFNRDLVLDLRFENNLNDSGSYRLHSKWYDGAAGSFDTGKSGQGITLNGDQTVQVATRNEYWSTDEGKHGTWKYTEMKFNTTMEAWVYPTEDINSEYSIFTKHVGYSQGGYAFTLTKVNGKLRAALNIQADNNGVTQGGVAGVRGAYSSVAVPLNTWTHVAATFDKNGPDKNPGDPSVGRIRIYVNGLDVTTSNSSGNLMQPGANETSIFAYSENSGWNESDNGPCDIDSRIGYTTYWCASEFSVGGFTWQNGFVGKIDEVKVWNITKNAAYFDTYDQQTAPYISMAEGMVGSDKVTVTFSEGVYSNPGMSGVLVPADFVLTDADNGRTILSVSHTAGSNTAVLTLSSPLDASNDINTDTIAPAANAVYDKYDNAAVTTAVTITFSLACPTAPVTINLNEASGSAYVFDNQGVLVGQVAGGAATLTGSAYSGGGDGSGRYIDFEYNGKCLQATTAMTLEARIKPTGISSANYIRRILARDGGGNYQLSVWRNNTDATNFPNYNAPVGSASIALWVRVVDQHGGDAWKPVLTDYTAYPIVSDHWYYIKAVWNTNKPGGTPGQPFVPAEIWLEDQGTDGSGTGRLWVGLANATKTDQSYHASIKKLYTADEILPADGDFVIGANVSNHANNLFNGLIDWIKWKDTID